MRGPFERLKYDLRRLWECPVCKRRDRTTGTVTFRHCSCQMNKADGKFIVMKLVEDSVQRLTPVVRIKHEPLVATAVDELPSSERVEAVPASKVIEPADQDSASQS
jgi:hypothetical protein